MEHKVPNLRRGLIWELDPARGHVNSVVVGKTCTAATFTRLLGATYWDEGILKTAPAHTPRIEFIDGRKGLLLEALAENICTQSRNFDSDWTIIGGMQKTQDQTGIDGVANTAWTLKDDDGAGYEYCSFAAVVADDSATHTGSIFIKKDSDVTRFPEIQFGVADVPSQNNVQLNTKTGAVVQRAGGVGDYGVDDYGLWWRLWLNCVNNSGGHTSLVFLIAPAITTVIGTLNVAAVGSIVVDGVQMGRAVSLPSSFVETAGAEVTRSTEATYPRYTLGDIATATAETLAPCGAELVLNGGFASATTSWTASGTLASVAGGQSGNCLRITEAGAGWPFATQTIAVTAGKTYKVEYYVKAGTEATWLVEIYDQLAALLFTDGGEATGAFVKHTHYYTAPAGTTSFQIALWQTANPAAGTTIFYDEVSMIEDFVINGDFTSDVVGWGVENAAVLASVAGGDVGNCLRITEDGIANPGASQAIAVTAGKKYKVSFAVKSGTEATWLMQIYNQDAELLLTTGNLESTGSFVTHIRNFVATTGTTAIAIVLWQIAAIGAGTTILFDTVRMQEITTTAQGTAIMYFRPGFASADITASQGLLGVQNNVGSILGIKNAVTLWAYDETTNCETTPTFVRGTWIKLVCKWGYETSGRPMYRVGYGQPVAWGTAQPFDGAFTQGTVLQIATIIAFPQHIGLTRIYNRVLTDAEIDLVGSETNPLI